MTRGKNPTKDFEVGKGAKWFHGAVVALVTLFPLVVVPGIERPFSTPKVFLLGGMVVAGGVCAIMTGVFSRPTLPQGFRLSLIAWPSALAISAARGDFLSYEVLWLSLLAMGWFFLVVGLRPKAAHIAMGVVSSCGIVAAIALLQYFDLDPFRLFGWTAPLYGSPRMRVFGTLGNPNFVGALLVAGMPLSLALGKITNRRLFFSVLILLSAFAVFATGSRAAVLALAAALISLNALGQLPRRGMVVAAVLGIMILPAFMPSRPLATTLQGRFYIWRVAFPHVFERPLFGYGPGAFEPKYLEWETFYWRDGHGSPGERQFAALQAHAHNDYLEIFVDSGFSGLLAWVFLLGSFFSSRLRHARSPGGELVAAASAGVVALAVVGLVDFPFHRPTELFMVWTLMAIACLENPPSTSV